MIDLPTIDCKYETEAALYMAYMPYLSGGGLFVRNNSNFPLGTQVKLSIKLLNEPTPYLITAQVAWITPKGAQANKPAGLGFQFLGDESRALKNKIETHLAAMLKSSQMTDTM